MNLQNEFNSFFTPAVVERLSSLIGLDRTQTETGLRQILPHQLDALADAAANPQTASLIDRVLGRTDLPADPMQALSTPETAMQTEELGSSLMNELLGGAGFLERLGIGSNLTRLAHLSLPLLLGFLQRSGVRAVGDMTGLRGSLASMLPAAAVAGAAAAPEIVDTVAAKPAVEVEEGQPVVTEERVLEGRPEPTPVPPPVEEKKGCNPLWLIPLLLLIGLGWWLANRNQETKTVTTQETTVTQQQTEASTPAAVNTTDEGIVVENIQDGADLPLEPFQMSGTGPKDDVISITDANNEVLATETIGEDGKWLTDLPAPVAGENVYTLTGDPSGAVSTVRINGVEGAAAAPAAGAATEAASTPAEGAATTPVEGAETAVVPVEIIEPANGAQVAAETFTIVGKGQPNATYTVYEDGVNVGTVFTDEGGEWRRDVVAATPGDHKYLVIDERGGKVAELPLVVAEPVAVDDCSTNNVLSLSLGDGDTVSAPFRFGGTGSAKSYLVKVFRGDNQIGEKTVENGANCTWSYLSEPGGKEDQVGEITYEVYPDGSTDVDTRVTLKVIQSGVNFEGGEYVGPTETPAEQ